MKSRYIKSRNITVNGIIYVYSVNERGTIFQIRVFKDKTLLLVAHFSPPTPWGINVFSPKTVEILIQYFNNYYAFKGEGVELWLPQEKKLFDIYLDTFFSEEESVLKESFLAHVVKVQSEYTSDS